MEEEVEKSIVQKKEPVRLKGRNTILYILLTVNTCMGIFIFNAQKRHTVPQEKIYKKSWVQEKATESHFVKFDLIATNLAEYDGPRRYVRVRPVIEVKKGKQYEEIGLKKKAIRNQIIALLNTHKPEDILNENGMEYLKKELKKIFKKTLTHTQINMIYFSEFRVN